MQAIVNKLSKIFGKGNVFKYLFNISPMYRGTGARLVKVSNDLKYVKIKLKLSLRTRNYVGTIYGGHLYSSVDGIYMVQLINILGSEFVVWDKSASIRFRRPGDQNLYAEFDITDDLLKQIKTEIKELGQKDYILKVDLKDKDGKVYAEVEKVIYIATKEFYRNRKKEKAKIQNVTS